MDLSRCQFISRDPLRNIVYLAGEIDQIRSQIVRNTELKNSSELQDKIYNILERIDEEIMFLGGTSCMPDAYWPVLVQCLPFDTEWADVSAGVDDTDLDDFDPDVVILSQGGDADVH